MELPVREKSTWRSLKWKLTFHFTPEKKCLQSLFGCGRMVAVWPDRRGSLRLLQRTDLTEGKHWRPINAGGCPEGKT